LDRSSAYLKSWNLEPSEKGVLKKKSVFEYLVNHGYPRQIEQFDF
jgi:hypothetical protein